MKRNLYLLSIGLLLCSCSESYDTITGHARVITRNTPVTSSVITPEEAPVAAASVAPQPAEAPVSTSTEPQYQSTGAEAAAASVTAASAPTPLFSQNQPKPAEPDQPTIVKADTPAAPEVKKEERAPIPEYLLATPAPVAQVEEKKPEPIVTQKQPVTTVPPIETQAQITASTGNQDKPTIITKSQPAPVVSATPLMVKPKSTPVAQQQPSYSEPRTQSTKRTYPVMPGQNRGLRRRNNTTY